MLILATGNSTSGAQRPEGLSHPSRLISNVPLISRAVSLDDYESLGDLPASERAICAP
jgi:hypothetical protein